MDLSPAAITGKVFEVVSGELAEDSETHSRGKVISKTPSSVSFGVEMPGLSAAVSGLELLRIELVSVAGRGSLVAEDGLADL